jgi:ABC-2 type transport system permease protein
MNPRRLRSITRRIVDQFRRDPRTLALIFVVPVAVTGLLGWVLGDRQTVEPRVAIVDLDPASRGFVAGAFERASTASGLKLVTGLTDNAAVRAALSKDDLDLAIVIPSGFGQSLASGGSAAITIVTQGADPLGDASRIGELQRVVSTALLDLAPSGLGGRVSIQRETVFLSPDASMLDALAPIFVGYFGYFFVFILTGVSFLRERVGGTLERLLATPITKPEIVLGYSLGFGIFATLQVIVLLAFVLGRLDVPALGPLSAFTIGLAVPTAGSPLLLFFIALLLALGAVNLGIFLSTFARTELQVIQFIPIVIVPQGLLAGIFWPVASLPAPLQPIAHVLPLTYAVEALRDVMIRGQGLEAAGVQLAVVVLAAIAGLLVILASATIRREIA